MRVCLLEPDLEAYRMFVFADERDARIALRFDGRPLSEWTPISVEGTNEEESGGNFPYPDFGGLGSVPVFSRKAVLELGDLLTGSGELLPLRHESESIFAYNVTRVVDALDEEESTILRYRTGNLKEVTEYSFFPHTLVNAPVFKIPQIPRPDIFVTDEFIDRTQRAGLTGFLFRDVWSSSP